MNIRACDYCGVVYDFDKLNFPDTIRDEDGCVLTEYAVWNGYSYTAYVDCKVCGNPIPEEEE